MAITPSSAAASTAAFFKSVIEWLQVGYPEGVPPTDRIALLELLRSTPLDEHEIKNAVDAVDEIDTDTERDVIADFIADMSHYDASPESVARVAAKLAAAGWPLAGIQSFVKAEAAEAKADGESSS